MRRAAGWAAASGAERSAALAHAYATAGRRRITACIELPCSCPAGVFANNGVSELLRADAPGGMRDMVSGSAAPGQVPRGKRGPMRRPVSLHVHHLATPPGPPCAGWAFC